MLRLYFSRYNAFMARFILWTDWQAITPVKKQRHLSMRPIHPTCNIFIQTCFTSPTESKCRLPSETSPLRYNCSGCMSTQLALEKWVHHNHIYGEEREIISWGMSSQSYSRCLILMTYLSFYVRKTFGYSDSSRFYKFLWRPSCGLGGTSLPSFYDE